MAGERQRCDVAVIGGGLAGLLAARALGSEADVVLVDGGPGPAAASSRCLGIVAAGGAESPARLASALGEARAAELWRWSADSCRRLLDLAEELGVPVGRGGSLRRAIGRVEAAEWEASVPLLRAWTGLDVTASEAVHVPGDGQLDPGLLLEALAGDRGVRRLAGPARIDRVGGDGVELALADRPLRAEMVVVAAGVGCPSVHGWFEPMLFPVRLQGLRTLPISAGSVPIPCLARHRFEAWLQEPSGALAFVGCRWAEQPEMEAGVTDDASISDAVLAKQRDFLARQLPDLELEVTETWTGIEAFSCDGLPLVGPLPGRARVIALTGWGGWGLSWIARAVADVTDSILGRGRPETPAVLAPRRML